MIRLGVGHGNGGAVEQLDRAPPPLPVLATQVLQPLADRDGKALDQRQRQTLPRFAVGATAQTALVFALRATLGQMPGHRILTRAIGGQRLANE